jgi:nucleoid DNA-binding protein
MGVKANKNSDWDRRRLAENLSDRTGLSIKDVEAVLRQLPVSLRWAIRADKRVFIGKLGTFYGKTLAAGSVTLPGGRRVSFPKRTRLAFKPVKYRPKRGAAAAKAKKAQR